MNACRVTKRPCAATPVTELYAGVEWTPACHVHALGFVELAEAMGASVQQRKPAWLRDVLDQRGDADVIPISRAERAA